jgi:protein-S-isoprenylcysteine O-methyltransferase Ste14
MHGQDVVSSTTTNRRLPLRSLVGSGDRIALFTLPITVIALALWAMDPSRFALDASSILVRAVAWIALAVGVVAWAWSVVLIFKAVPAGQLITSGPFAVVKHPIYTSVGLLVLPAAGVLLGTWLGVVIGLGLYVGARLFAPSEEWDLKHRFGHRWLAYEERVLLPWL